MSTKKNKKSCSSGFGERLKQIRKSIGLTQQECALLASVSVQSWRDYEAERAEVKLCTLAFLTERNVSFSWLITGTGSPFTDNTESVLQGNLAEWVKEEIENNANFYADFTADCAAYFSDFAEWIKKRKGEVAQVSTARRKVS